MNKSLHFLFLLLFITTALAQKDFTLKQVVLDYESITPVKLKQLQWIPGTEDFAYVKKIDDQNTLLKENAYNEGIHVLISYNSLNRIVKENDLPAMDSIPDFTWVNSNTIQFWNKHYLVNFNVDNNSEL